MSARPIVRALLAALLAQGCSSGDEASNDEPLSSPFPRLFKASEEPARTACLRALAAAGEPESSQLLGGTAGQSLAVLRELAGQFPKDSGMGQLSDGAWQDAPDGLVVLQCVFTPSSPGRPLRLVMTDLGSRTAAFDQPQAEPGAGGNLVPISPLK